MLNTLRPIASFFFCVALISGTAHAGNLALTCGRADVMNPAWNTPLTFAYDGGAKGTLNIGGTFGQFAIPASRAPLQIQPGEMWDGIDGVAKVLVKLPSLSDLDACIAKAGAGGRNDDAFANARDACLRKLPSASGVSAVAQIRLGVGGDDTSGEDAFVTFKLRYDATSTSAPDGKMVLEAFPAQCKLKK